MELRGVVQRRTATQPVNERETLAGRQLTFPFPKVTVTANENADISIRKLVHNQLSVASDASAVASSSGLGDPGPHILPSEEEVVVDMQQTRQLQNCVTIRSSETGLLQNLRINVRQEHSSCNAADEFADLLPRVEEEDSMKKRKSINYGDDADIIQLLDKMPSEGGVILRGQEVLRCDDGVYKEGEQYTLVPGNFSKGAFGEAALCQDLKTGKTFMRKTVKGKLSRNEIEVPLKFRGEMGIPEVYGVNINNKKVEIFQEFAGVSLKNLMEWDSSFVKQLRDYKRVLVIAFQAFATLVKLHSQGITHQDIKPENLCLSIQSNDVWLLKYIDFGSSQTPNDQVIEGLTNEYLSPESCNTILQVATGNLPVEKGRLGPGADVWALGLSLLYCLCGYHVMVYVCTRNFKYTEKDPAKLQQLRMQCLLKIRNLTDEDVLQELICPEWPENLKILLKNVLRVDPEKRWSAKHAAEFLRYCILSGYGAGKQQPAQSGASTVAPPASTAAAQAVGAPAGEAPTAPVVVAPRPATFQGLTPTRLMVQTRPQLQIRVPPQRSEERASEGQAVQCTSPMRTSSPPHPSMSPMSTSSPPHPSMSPMSTGSPPHPSMSPMSAGSPPPPPSPASSLDTPPPSQLPAFMDLLSNTTTPAQKSRRRGKAKQRVKPY